MAMESDLYTFSEETMRTVILPTVVAFILVLIFEYVRMKQTEKIRVAVKDFMLSLTLKLEREKIRIAVRTFISLMSQKLKRVRWKHHL